jgi:hypothetical protein
VMAALQQLAPDQREVLLLRMVSGLTVLSGLTTLRWRPRWARPPAWSRRGSTAAWPVWPGSWAYVARMNRRIPCIHRQAQIT